MQLHPMVKRGASWAVVATTLIGTWEGMALVAYPDRLAHNIPTVCAGVTRSEIPNLKVGDEYTRAECDTIVAKALPVYNAGISHCIHVPISDDIRGMTVSLSYNIGVAATCRSTFVRKLNAKDPNACEYMLWFNKASGKYVQGLENRREDEYRYCVRGLETTAPAVIVPPPPSVVPEAPRPVSPPPSVVPEAPRPVSPPLSVWQKIKNFFGGNQ